MVHQPLTDTGARRPHGNAEITQMPDRPDPGPQQHRRRMDGAATQDHLIAAKLGGLAVDHRANADAACILEQQLADLCLGYHGEVAALPDRGPQVAYRRGDAPVIWT